MRSISAADRPEVCHGLSGQVEPSKILRLRNQKNSGLSHKQLHFTAFDHLYALPISLAGRAIFQMDQAKSPNKNVLWHFGECRQDSNMDSGVGLCTCAIMKKQLNIRASLYTILQVISVSAFERTPLYQLLEKSDYKSETIETNQLTLFN